MWQIANSVFKGQMFGMEDMVKGHDECLDWHIYVACSVPWRTI
jgi:hypothetical protein